MQDPFGRHILLRYVCLFLPIVIRIPCSDLVSPDVFSIPDPSLLLLHFFFDVLSDSGIEDD